MLKVFTCNRAGDDIMLMGRIFLAFKNGGTVVNEFTARIVVGGAASVSPRFKLYQVFSVSYPHILAVFRFTKMSTKDTAPVIKAMQGF